MTPADWPTDEPSLENTTPVPEPPPVAATAPPESLPLIAIGLLFFGMVLAVLWFNATQQSRLTPPDTTQARMSTGVTLATLYQQHFGTTRLRAGLPATKLTDAARKGARQWRVASQHFATLAAANPAQRAANLAYAAYTRVDAAGLAGAGGDLKAARQYLDEAIRLDPAHAAAVRNLQPLYAASPRPVNLAGSAAVLRELSAAPLFRARAAELAHDDAALRVALAPGLTFTQRSMVVGGVMLLFVALLLAVFIISIAEGKRLRGEIAVADASAPPVPWDIGTALLVISAVFFLGFGLTTLAVMAFPHSGHGARLILSTVALPLSALLVSGGFLRLLGHRAWDWSVFGWRRAALGVGYGMLGLLVIYPAFLLVAYLSSLLFGGESHPLIPELMNPSSRWETLYLIVIAVVAAPLVEETLFRGVLLRALNARLPFWPAALISAVLFAAGHAQLSALLPIALLGVLLAFLARRTGSLVAPAAAHGFFNGISAGAALLYAWLLHGMRG